jgi:NitT/TauT family transport system permease protein
MFFYAAFLGAGGVGYALNFVFLVGERRMVHWSGR